ncbi:hypothetical protein D3Z52_07750 [Clostridiaceae bacterium]|nr:hypothetical protein [Clostridiaceae bacterium]
MKKVWTILLACLLCTALLAGCSSRTGGAADTGTDDTVNNGSANNGAGMTGSGDNGLTGTGTDGGTTGKSQATALARQTARPATARTVPVPLPATAQPAI